MGDSRAAPGFGHIDLDLEDESGRGFGPAESGSEEGGELGPSSTTRAQTVPRDPGTRVTRRALEAVRDDEAPPASVHEDRTRVVAAGESLTHAFPRVPPAADPHASRSKPPPRPQEDATRAWGTADEPPPSQNGGAPSGSGIAARDDRVAAMRELYAKGDATGALMLAASLDADETAPVPALRNLADHPDASIAVEFSLEEVDGDPFGGLIPIDVDDVLDERDHTVAFESDTESAIHTRPTPVPPPPQPIAGLSLTMRQSIPRVLKSPQEISKLPIDHRAGFLLAHFDGMQTLEEILDICAMPTDEALSLITELQEMGVIDLE
ncbi:MAG: hypothetical protein JST00_04430 [Deltaproteobacteria bacterium]|nr:hypothetical protein [Deltaproteobacteria bacterium]